MTFIVNKNNETIVAQCTPQGSGALALIRISGENALVVATALSSLASQKKLQDCPTHTIHYGSVVDDHGATIDTVLFLLMKAPRTFTGQDTVEISCHNNPFVIERVINRAVACGARVAQAGEFSQRAFLQGKIDLLQAEAINELIHANHQLSLRQSLAQLQGTLSAWVASVEKQLLKALAFSEASFEFIDEETTFGKQIYTILHNVLRTIDTCNSAFGHQENIRQGIRISFLGSVNAGKSSLFNALLKQKRAIVTDIPGTTRDVIEAGLYVEGTYWTLVDTAGLRTTDDVIEKEGIARSFEEARKADIVLLVFDGSRVITAEEQEVYAQLLAEFNAKCLVVCNKADLPYASCPELQKQTALRTSSLDVTTIELLHRALQRKVTALFSELESPFLLNKRHHQLLLQVRAHIIDTLPLVEEQHIPYELVSCHLHNALEGLSELTGKSISEQGMDAVFREFCVGK